MTDGLEQATQRWREDWFVVVPALVPPDEVDAAASELAALYAADTFDDYNRASRIGDGRPTGRRFRATQFDGMRGFPMPGCQRLNDVFIHPRLVEFARRALGDDDIRIYQAAVWSKWAGAVNYEQPLHRDGNHSLLPPRMEPGFWHMETFVYLTDVDEGSAPPRLVPVGAADGIADDDLYDHEVIATGPRGTVLAYRSDVWHRGTDFSRADAARSVLVVGFRPATAEWFSYDAFGRLGNNTVFAEFVRGKSPDELALFGVPMPGHAFWTTGTVDAMETKYPGLDMTPWRSALVD